MSEILVERALASLAASTAASSPVATPESGAAGAGERALVFLPHTASALGRGLMAGLCLGQYMAGGLCGAASGPANMEEQIAGLLV